MSDMRLVILLFLSQLTCVRGSQSTSCSLGLGLEDGRITSHQITSTSHSLTPDLGRLNEQNGSWCFNYEKDPESRRVEFRVDLGQLRLLSGFQSQGPPTSLHGFEYTRYVGLGIELSKDGRYWTNLPKQFYASDEPDSADAIQTHAFDSIHTARFIKIYVSSDVRWIGHSEKCFRFEILGCPLDLSLNPNFSHTLHPQGLISAQWSSPSVFDADDRLVSLVSSFYIVDIIAQGSERRQVNVSQDASFILDNPLWDASYEFNILCMHDNVSINCGRHSIQTLPIDKSNSGDILFDKPMSLKALFHDNGTLGIEWTPSNKGWRSLNRIVKLRNANGGVLFTEITEDNFVVMDNVRPGDHYVSFEPGGTGIPQDSEYLRVHLLIIPNVENEETYAFLGATDLSLSIIWSGSLVARWSPCKGRRGETESRSSVIDVEEYRIFLLNDDSSPPQIIMEERISPMDKPEILFSGMSLNSTYTVQIQCSVLGKVFDCGQEPITAIAPRFSTLYKNKSEIYVPTPFPGTWSTLSERCSDAGGSLVSLDRNGLEEDLMALTHGKDFWTGGNICYDSPAPSDSMWSDGSLNPRINFAANSGLDANHCCVKNSRNEATNESFWRGENCQTILYGICEYVFSDILDNLSNIRAESSSTNSILLSWDTQGLSWQPASYEIFLNPTTTLSNTSQILLPQKSPIKAFKSPVQIDGLYEFSEYNLQIKASLVPYFNVNKTFYAKGRTLPSKDVEFTISPQGTFTASWQRKMALFKDSETVRLNVSSDGFQSYHLLNGSAASTELSTLRFGESYAYYMEDESGSILGPLGFEAYPNCTYGVRNNTHCVFIPPQNSTYAERNEDCGTHGFTSDTILEDPELLYFSLWNGLHGNSLFWIQSNGSSLDSDDRSLCRAWSRSLRLFTFTDCQESLPVLCFGNLPVEFSAPSKRDLRIASGPTHITIDWNASREGWFVNYTVSVRDELRSFSSNRSKRSASQIHVHSPPINITGLTPQRSYSLTVRSSLDANTVRTLTLEGVSTTSDARVSREIKILTSPRNDVLYAQISFISVAAVITFIAIILLAWSRTMSLYPENLVQLCLQIVNLLFYISFMLFSREGPLGMESQSQVNCLLGIWVFNYLCMCGAVFLLLESMIVMHQLVDSLILPYLAQNVSVFAFLGFGLPLVYVSSSVVFLSEFLMPSREEALCWMNLTAMESSVFYAPMAVLILLTLFFTLVSLCGSSKATRARLMLTPGEATRLRTLSSIRVAIFFLAICQASTWITGICFAHFGGRDETLFAYLSSALAQSLITLFFRIFYDREVMARIKRTRMSPSEVEEQYVKEGAQVESRKASALSRRSLLQSHPRSLSSQSIITPVESNESSQVSASSHPLASGSSNHRRPLSVASISDRISEEGMSP